MSQQSKKIDLLNEVKTLIAEKWSTQDAAVLTQWVDHYYRDTPNDDIALRTSQDLYGAAVSHWQYAQRRTPGQDKVRFYNPDIEEHGWESTHSIVEIVTDDRPFLVDSLSMALNRLGLTIHLVVHPVIGIERNKKGEALGLSDTSTQVDAVIRFEVDRQTGQSCSTAVVKNLSQVLKDVRVTVNDWQTMRSTMQACRNELEKTLPKKLNTAINQENLAFLDWLIDNHFTFLGYKSYDLQEQNDTLHLHATPNAALGLLKQADSAQKTQLPIRRQELEDEPSALIITKTSRRSSVHRPSYLDYIGIKRYDKQGRVIGEHRFIGLYTSAAYSRNPSEIPLLNLKLKYAIEQTRFPKASHAGKALTHILETFPRDELYQISSEQLYQTSIGILHLQERQRVKLFTRADRYLRFITCLVFAPRDRYNTQIRKRMETILHQTFDAKDIEFSIELSNAVLARIYFVIHLREHTIPPFDQAELERQIAETTRSWSDRLYEALIDLYGEEKGNRFFSRYEDAFPAGYRDDINHLGAAHDVKRLESLKDDNALSLNLYRPLEHHTAPLRFRIYQRGHAIELSDALPMLENMGVKVIDERPYEITANDNQVYWAHDFGMHYQNIDRLNTEQIKLNFQDAFAAIWRRQAENDRFNTLILACGLNWREISILRAYCKYLKQTGTSYSFRYIAETLEQNPQITHLLIQLFHQRHKPKHKSAKAYSITVEAIEEALNDVPSLDQDKIIRRVLAAILATLRTNYYQKDENNEAKSYLSLKIEPRLIPEMPEPTPKYEIFVCSPETEGVHLRGGSVARGGLRWSDRLEDYRTEVLGLVKAQMVKNAVIVPVGAKGGFIAKRLDKSATRDQTMDVVKSCYRTFIRGLLDITDNIIQGTVVPPHNVVRHDGDDPYLVVAADKGTATFSDIANGISAEYKFWLGDAFASGGSVGYDHKAMGITAKGGWESVKRHFREMGIDTQSSDFTVVGIGDMSGDVFGNGMLLSKHIRLVAAFDHRHIFIDPHPDPAKSFKERERLFGLARSSWEDYDATLISKGGGVFSRTLKSINLSVSAREVLNINESQLSPNDLIHRILKAPVELIWNGGIGTYVKSKQESHADAGDKANDAVRVNGGDLRCKVFGEGGNLGMTQLGRIEFATKGGRVNTDFIDNSAGVDCSDHEVNIKILLNQVVSAGDMTTKQRKNLLADMTDEVSELVLRHNYAQTQALTLELANAQQNIDAHTNLIRELEKECGLDRSLEHLPSDDEIQERKLEQKGLTRPELCTLLAYAKINAYNKLLESDLPEDPYFNNVVVRYFPTPLRDTYQDIIPKHSLAREIIATTVCNQMINRLGVSNLFFLSQLTGAHTADVMRAFNATRDIFRLPEIWQEIDDLDNTVSAHCQTDMLLASNKLATRGALWLLRNRKQPLDMQQVVKQFGERVYSFNQGLDKLIQGASRTAMTNRANQLQKSGTSKKLGLRIATMPHTYATLDLVSLSDDSGLDIKKLGEIYYASQNALDCDWILRQVRNLETATGWQMRSAIGLEDEWYKQQRDLTLAIAQSSSKSQKATTAVNQWQIDNDAAICRFKRIIAELKNTTVLDFSMLSVAVQEMRHLAQIGLHNH